MRKIFLIPFFMVTCFMACDKTEPFDTPPNQVGNGNGGSGTDTSGTDTTGTDTTVILNVQKVLLEDLTGFRCTNCPDAHNVANSLSQLYGDQLIVIGVHCSWQFSTPNSAGSDSYTTDFRTDAAVTYFEELYGQPSLPNGVINRRVFDNSILVPHSQWAEKVDPLLQATPLAKVNVSINSYNEATRQVNLDVEMETTQTMDPGQYFMIAHLVEDSIYDWQLNNGVDVENYLHRHVLRDNINGTWGDLAFSDGSAGQENTLSYNYTLDEAWKEEHCEIIAYIYNADTREIVQVDKKLVMNP